MMIDPVYVATVVVITSNPTTRSMGVGVMSSKGEKSKVGDEFGGRQVELFNAI
jgi:hypothetical protein